MACRRAARASDRREADLTAQEWDLLWAVLGEADAGRAFQVSAALVAGDKTAAFLDQRLRPGPPVSRELLAQWIEHLDSPNFSERQKAAIELEKLGDQAKPDLVKALQRDSSLEMRERTRAAARQAGQCPGGETAITAHLEILEYIGTPQARRLGPNLAQGSERITGSPNRPARPSAGWNSKGLSFSPLPQGETGEKGRPEGIEFSPVHGAFREAV